MIRAIRAIRTIRTIRARHSRRSRQNVAYHNGIQYCTHSRHSRARRHSSATKPTKPGRHTRRGRPNSVRRPIRGLAVPSIPSIRTILNTIMASSQAIRREQSIPQIGQDSTHVAHHVMLKQQSFKRGGRGRSQIVETRQGSKIDRREEGGRERRARLGKGVRGKRSVFSKQCRCLHVEFLAWYLPNTYLPQGIWSRAPFASEKEQY